MTVETGIYRITIESALGIVPHDAEDLSWRQKATTWIAGFPLATTRIARKFEEALSWLRAAERRGLPFQELLEREKRVRTGRGDRSILDGNDKRTCLA